MLLLCLCWRVLLKNQIRKTQVGEKLMSALLLAVCLQQNIQRTWWDTWPCILEKNHTHAQSALKHLEDKTNLPDICRYTQDTSLSTVQHVTTKHLTSLHWRNIWGCTQMRGLITVKFAHTSLKTAASWQFTWELTQGMPHLPVSTRDAVQLSKQTQILQGTRGHTLERCPTSVTTVTTEWRSNLISRPTSGSITGQMKYLNVKQRLAALWQSAKQSWRTTWRPMKTSHRVSHSNVTFAVSQQSVDKNSLYIWK